MSTSIWLTNEESPLAGYRRARLGRRSDACSLTSLATATVAGPTSGVTIASWLTDPLQAVSLTAATWEAHCWMLATSGSATGLRVIIKPFTNVEGTKALDHDSAAAIPTTVRDLAITTAAATPTSLAEGSRLAITLVLDDAPAMGVGTATLYYNGSRARVTGDSYLLCPDNLLPLAQTPDDTILLVRQTLKDTDSLNPLLSDDDIVRGIAGALDEYSQARPQVLVASLSGTGSQTVWELPSGWVNDFSRVLAVEYPTGNNPAEYLNEELYGLYAAVSSRQLTLQLRFASAPSAGTDNVYVSYTSRHSHDTLDDTIPPADFDAFVCLAASRCALALASKQAASSDSTIISDSTDHRGGDLRWRNMATALRSRYEEALGLNGPVAPASKTGNWDAYMSDRTDRLTHPRLYR